LTFVEWFTASDGLLAGDYIMVVCSNQTGTATALELTSATGSWTKLDSTDSPRVGTFLRSQIWWHKYDGTTCRPSRQHPMGQPRHGRRRRGLCVMRPMSPTNHGLMST
jgi:hypothetical protein